MKIKVQITLDENIQYFHCKKNDIVEVDFEDYVAAVVGSEIGKQSLNACKAQAIAARTYAVFNGVLDGKVISDSYKVAQAFRAKRMSFDVCKQAVMETRGMVLYYNNKPINAVYSNSNGGRTVSAKTKWGSVKAYLVEQDDPWDKAFGAKKDGHGVGMSQCGARWAAEHGADYIDILKFYYPNTIIKINYGKDNGLVTIKQLIEEILESLK